LSRLYMHRIVHPCGAYLLRPLVIQYTLADIEHDPCAVTNVAHNVKIDPRQVTTSIDPRGSVYVIYYPHHTLFPLRYKPPNIYWDGGAIDRPVPYSCHLYYASVVYNVIVRCIKILYVTYINLYAETATFCYLIRRHYLYYHCLRRRRGRRNARCRRLGRAHRWRRRLSW
jgi:hypothetical protein